MRLDGALIPDGLVHAFDEGRLTLFAGAGVSNGAPSCVPLLGGLAGRVEAELGVPSIPDERDGDAVPPPVERLGRHASAGLGVHEAVHKIVSESTEPNDTHRAVCGLARAMGPVRIVTTNYDRHLSACLPGGTRVYEAPDFPGDGDFAGVVHLHGSVGQEPGRLVVTEADFARSYMQWNSSTLSFLHRLFATQTVLFVGYSVDDTLMRYILRATETAAGIYVLTRDPDSPEWAELGVEAVGYRSHDDLPDLLGEWAERSAAGADYHDRRVGRITAGTSGIEDLSALDGSYLTDLVGDADWVRIFTNHARGPVWLRWAATRPGAKLFAPKADLGAADLAVAEWFIAHHNDDEESAVETLRLIVENSGSLHERMWLNMAMGYDPRGGATRETGNRLMLALAEAAPPVPRRGACLLNLLDSCATPEDDSLFLELVDRAFAPALTALDPPQAHFGLHGPFQTAVADPAGGWLQETVDKEYWSRRRHLAADLLAIIDGHLRRVCRIEEIAGNPDPYDARSAIEAHDQDRGFGDKGFLVDAARDLVELLIDDDPQNAAGHLASWAASAQPILNRLAIHCWAYRSDVSAEAKIEWLLGQEKWAIDARMHHEVAMLAAAASGAAESAIGPLVALIASDPEGSHPQISFDMLGWVARHARESDAARHAFQQARDANPGIEMSEHPEFTRWISVTAGPAPPAGGMTAEEITGLVADDPGEAAERLLAEAVAADSPHSSRRDWFATRSACQEAVRLSPETGLALLDALADRAAQQPEPTRRVATGILLQLTEQTTVSGTARDHRDKLEATLVKLWDAGTAHWECPPTHEPWQGWAQETISSWPGAVVALCIHKATVQRAADPQAWAGLPEIDRGFLEAAISGDTEAAKRAQAACAGKLAILHDADRQWAADRLLPLMDPGEDADRAFRCWDACLPSLRWGPELLEDGLLGHLAGFCEHAEQCSGIALRGFARLAAGLCLYADLEAAGGVREWLRQFTARAAVTIRTEFMRTVLVTLLEQDPEARAAQWSRWMRCYWQDRIGGLPRPLDTTEASALADWAILLDSDFPEAVELARRSNSPLQEYSMLPAEMHRAARGIGRCIHLLEQHPGTLAQHVSNLIANTDSETLQRVAMPMTALIRQLQDRADEADFQPLQEQALQLGWGQTAQ